MHVSGHRRGFLRARTALVAGAVLVIGLVATVATAAAGGGANDESIVVPSRFAKISAATALLPDLAQIAKWLPASMQDRPVTVALKMTGDPVAIVNAKNGNKLTAAQRASIRDDLKAKQNAIAPSIAKAGGTILGQMADAYNGILVTTTVGAIPTLSALPGVASVVSVKSFQPDNLHGAAVIAAPQAWQTFAGANPGAGIKVADVDSGVDYTHADFGGPGTVAAYTAAHAHADDATLDPSVSGSFGAAAPKVKGGYDFAGDGYNAAGSGAALTPHPDPNPLDCNSGSTAGHGTHVSGTIAGFGVLPDGTTYSGNYNGSTISPADASQLFASGWKVGPGIAPKADLYMYRVFGCAGSSSIVSLGIDKAVADGVNVINLSLGSPFGGQDDPTSMAVQAALDAGVTVVTSAGNSGSAGYIVGSPSTTNGALSVASIDGSVQNFPAGSLALTPGGTIKAIDANSEDNAGSNVPTATGLHVKVVRNPDGSVSLGCSVAAFQAANVTGAVAVVARGTCARVSKAIYGSDAGAAAVVLINNAAELPPFEGKITQNPDTGDPANVTIPFLGVPGPLPDPANGVAGSAEAQALLAADGGTVDLAPSQIANPGYLRAASFSSGGPRFGDSAPKPEVSAPGVSVRSAGVGTGSVGVVESGTSMAAPMTSGIAVLVKQTHPTWGPAQIKAAISNTAQASKLNGNPNARITGAGLVQADRAVSTDVVATTADNLDSLAFGFFEGSGAFAGSKTFTLTNYGATPVTYNLASSSGLLTVSPTSVTVNPGTPQDVTATLSVPAAAFATVPSNDTFSVGPGGVLTLRGAVTATPASGPSLRVPYLLAYRGESNVTAGSLAPYVKQPSSNVYTTSVPVSNSGIHSGTADVYAWGIHDPQENPAVGPDIRDVGTQSFADGTIVFAVSNYDASSTQAVSEYDVAIDKQNNGKPDFFVVGVDLGAVLTGSYNGQLGSFTIDAKTGAVVDAFIAEAPTNSSIVELPTTAADLGLHAANTSFHYAVNSFSALDGSHTDSTSAAAYDIAKQGVSSGNFVPLAAGASATIPLAVDYDKFQSAPALGWLVVSTDDPSGAAMADEVPVGTVK